MDLRAFGVGPRTWLEKLRYRLADRLLIAFGVAILLGSFGVGFFGLGKFWVPEALFKLVTR
jgi:energy-coupling factor transport system permease protein